MPRLPAFRLSPPVRRVAPVAWWGAYLLYLYAIFTGWHEGPVVTWGFTGLTLLAAVASYYFFARVVLPRWLLRRRWLLTGLGLPALYYGWALLNYGWMSWLSQAGLVSHNMHTYVHRILDHGVWTGVFGWYGVSIGLYDFGSSTMPPLLVCCVRFLLLSANRSLRLERENLRLEVEFLQAQVHPHFLFNTLNNLYTLVVKRDARAPRIVQHLRELLHYTVFEAAAPLAPLGQEVAFLEAYLALERLRYGPQVRLAYQPGGPLPPDLLITPLLLFPFVENAFKHGIDSSLDAAWVDIEWRVAGPQLYFAVRNSRSPGAPRRAAGGVGLANARKRLALHYPAAGYELTITQTSDTYVVQLTLTLLPAAAPLPATASRRAHLPALSAL